MNDISLMFNFGCLVRFDVWFIIKEVAECQIDYCEDSSHVEHNREINIKLYNSKASQ